MRPQRSAPQLMAASDEAWLERDPIEALYRGDLRYAGRHGEYLRAVAFVVRHGAGCASRRTAARSTAMPLPA